MAKALFYVKNAEAFKLLGIAPGFFSPNIMMKPRKLNTGGRQETCTMYTCFNDSLSPGKSPSNLKERNPPPVDHYPLFFRTYIIGYLPQSIGILGS